MARQNKEEKLKKDALKASRIEQVLASPGWKDIQEIIQDKYNDCMTELLKKENPEARGGINAIIEIMDRVSTDIQFGENARKQYNKIFSGVSE